MRLAADELEAENRITVIDSANLSTGIGLLVIEAAIMAKNGHSASEIASVMETLNQMSEQALSWIPSPTCTVADVVTLLLPWPAVS